MDLHGWGKTRIDHELEMNPRGLFWLMMPIMWSTGKLNLHLTVDAFKRYLEGGSSTVQSRLQDGRQVVGPKNLR